MTTSELLIQITTNEQTIFNELNDILTLQDEYINPKITFEFNHEERTILEKDAYWNDTLSFMDISTNENYTISNNNGYAQWIYYTVQDSQGNLVKYNEPIKDNEQYYSSCVSEIIIRTSDGKDYLIKNDTLFWNNAITIMIDYGVDSRFYYENPDIVQSDVLFKPEEDGPVYRILNKDAGITPIGTIVNATLVEGGNE